MLNEGSTTARVSVRYVHRNGKKSRKKATAAGFLAVQKTWQNLACFKSKYHRAGAPA